MAHLHIDIDDQGKLTVSGTGDLVWCLGIIELGKASLVEANRQPQPKLSVVRSLGSEPGF